MSIGQVVIEISWSGKREYQTFISLPWTNCTTFYSIACYTCTTFFSDFSDMIRSSNIYDCKRTKRNFWMQFFASCYHEHWTNYVWLQVHLNTLFPKRNGTSLVTQGIQFSEITLVRCTQTFHNCERTMINSEMGFLARCHHEHCQNGV